MDVKRISASDTYKIRQMLLRATGTVEDCHFKDDDKDQTFHLGAFEEGKLVSVASFYFENHLNHKDEFEYQYRLRGMATLPEVQGKGHSSSLLKTAFPIIAQNQCHFLWCNARTSAQGFYEKVGFQSSGKTFNIESIGPHILMHINIK
jgi:predicted GNAT family N-acyltransferase